LRKESTNLRARFGLTPAYFPAVFRKSEAGSPSWDVTTSIFTEIEKEFSARSTPALFVLIPTAYQTDEQSLQKYVKWFDIDTSAIDLDQPNRELAARFAAAGLALADPTPRIREMQSGGARLYGTVDAHLNENGIACWRSF